MYSTIKSYLARGRWMIAALTIRLSIYLFDILNEAIEKELSSSPYHIKRCLL